MSKMKTLLITGTLVITAAVTVASGLGPKNTVTIFTDGGFVEVKTNKTIIEEILLEADLIIDKQTHKVYPTFDEKLVTDYIAIKKATTVVLKVDGQEHEIITWAETVQDLLEEQKIELSGGDIVNMPLDRTLKSGHDIKVVRIINKMVTEEESIPAFNSYYFDSKLQLGSQKVHQQSKDGTKKITYNVTYNDGVEVDRKKIEEVVVAQAVPGIIYQNTKELASRSSREYAVVGVASYYGAKFHGRNTASGEVYNMNALTAAHRTLPFGTIVEVTFMTTGRTVTVRINDRGPFIAGRIIDLSEAAAKQVGLRPYGIGEVRIRVVR